MRYIAINSIVVICLLDSVIDSVKLLINCESIQSNAVVNDDSESSDDLSLGWILLILFFVVLIIIVVGVVISVVIMAIIYCLQKNSNKKPNLVNVTQVHPNAYNQTPGALSSQQIPQQAVQTPVQSSSQPLPNQSTAQAIVPPPQQPQTTAATQQSYANPDPNAAPNQYYPYKYPYYPPNTVPQTPDGFDSGARFDGIAAPTIPPPPPGVAPNAAQVDASQGKVVKMGQKQESLLQRTIMGNSNSGGYVFW